MVEEQFEYGLGRQPAADANDHNFPMRRALALVGSEPAVTPGYAQRRYRYADAWWGDQGAFPHCVGYGWTHFVEDGPIVYLGKQKPYISPEELYKAAQKVDEWPGENYEGTSVRAGAKVLKARGLISSYWWAFDLDTVLRGIDAIGPVVMGTNWYASMFRTDAGGFLDVRGRVVGGHCFLANGYNRSRQIVRCKNSWGRGWGKNGHFYLTFDDFSRLLSEDGEACIATEVRKV